MIPRGHYIAHIEKVVIWRSLHTASERLILTWLIDNGPRKGQMFLSHHIQANRRFPHLVAKGQQDLHRMADCLLHSDLIDTRRFLNIPCRIAVSSVASINGRDYNNVWQWQPLPEDKDTVRPDWLSKGNRAFIAHAHKQERECVNA